MLTAEPLPSVAVVGSAAVAALQMVLNECLQRAEGGREGYVCSPCGVCMTSECHPGILIPCAHFVCDGCYRRMQQQDSFAGACPFCTQAISRWVPLATL